MSDSHRTARGRYRRGLTTSVIGNASAFGFSVMITASFGMLEHFHENPAPGEVALFALGAVVAIALIEAVTSRGFRRRPASHPEEVIMLGTAANAVSVAVALAMVYGAGRLVPAPAVWVVAPLLAAGVYVLVEAAELAVAEGVQEWVLKDPDAESEE